MDSQIEIPQGRTKEEIQHREKFIKDFYANWNAANPEKRIYNTHIQAFIYVKFLSIQETSEKAARSYKSTLAVTYLTEILELAKVIKNTKPKEGNKKQSRFSEVIIMQYSKKKLWENQTDSRHFTWKSQKNTILYHSNRKYDCTTRNKHAIVIQSYIF